MYLKSQYELSHCKPGLVGATHIGLTVSPVTQSTGRRPLGTDKFAEQKRFLSIPPCTECPLNRSPNTHRVLQ